MMSKLKKDGVLSISLPTDPGIAWRLGRLFIRLFTIKKTYQISGEEFNYMNATEHVNSIFKLISSFTIPNIILVFNNNRLIYLL